MTLSVLCFIITNKKYMNLEYQDLNTPIQLKFSSDNLDLLQVGILGSELHRLFNQIAIALIQEENKKLDERNEPLIEYHIPQSTGRDDILIRARVTALRQGSIEIDLAAFVALVFSQPGAVAIIHNIAANAIWAISSYSSKIVGCSVTTKNSTQGNPNLPKTSAKRRLGPIIERVFNELKSSSNGGEFILKSGEEEVIIRINGNQKNRTM